MASVRVGQKLIDRSQYDAAYYEANKGRRRAQQQSHERRYLRTPEGRAKSLVKNARARARAFGREFSINADTITAALVRGTCAVSGIPFVLDAHGVGQHPLSPSIDRIDSSRGYTDDNVRVVVWAVNMACSTWGLEAYMAIASRVLGQSNPATTAVLARLQENT
jgi:hypothetical protein